MRFRKPRGVLLGIGFGAFAIAAALFFLVPVILKDGLQYNSLSALLSGLKSLISFNFVDVLYTALAVLFVCAIALLIVFAVVLISKKHKKHLIDWFFSLICIFGSYVLVATYFLANDIELTSGATKITGKLLESMLKVDGQMLGKILSSVALSFMILSNIMLVVHLFVCMVAMMVTDQIDEIEKQVESDKEKELNDKLAELAVMQAAVAEKSAESVAVVTAEALISEAEFEERKERETKLFKECVDSGYFSEYEELEFPKPLDGFEEEPVCEISFVEEKSSLIRKSSVHVGFTHE